MSIGSANSSAHSLKNGSLTSNHKAFYPAGIRRTYRRNARPYCSNIVAYQRISGSLFEFNSRNGLLYLAYYKKEQKRYEKNRITNSSGSCVRRLHGNAIEQRCG